MNLEQAREFMIERQVRTWEVLDPVVLEVLRSIPREDFVPGRFKNLAFADINPPVTIYDTSGPCRDRKCRKW